MFDLLSLLHFPVEPCKEMLVDQSILSSVLLKCLLSTFAGYIFLHSSLPFSPNGMNGAGRLIALVAYERNGSWLPNC